MICIEGCLSLVARLDIDIVEFLTDIKLSNQLRDQEKQILVLNSNCIENPVVIY